MSQSAALPDLDPPRTPVSGGSPQSIGRRGRRRTISVGADTDHKGMAGAIESFRQRFFLPRKDGGDGGHGGGGLRRGMDLTGLRKALILRVLGSRTEMRSPTGDGVVGVTGGGQHRRRLSTGSIAVGSFLRRKSGPEEDQLVIVIDIWVLDVESGVDWRITKSVNDLLGLHDACNMSRPGVLAGEFPLKRPRVDSLPGVTSPTTLSQEKLEKIERYLRKLSNMILDASPNASSYELSKMVQDFVGATERSKELSELQHRNGDVTRQLLQVYSCDLLRGPVYERRLSAYIDEVRACDVARSDILRSLAAFIGALAHDVMAEHSERLKAIIDISRRGGEKRPLDDDEADALCLSCLRRVIEAEVYVPLRSKVKERLDVEIDQKQEALLATKLSVFRFRPQTAYGIPVSQLSVSSWEAAVTQLRRVGASMLPSDMVDGLVATLKEVHAVFEREHPGAKPLGADELLPIFIYVVAQAGLPHLLATKHSLELLVDPARRLSEAGYCIATLEAALDFLLQLDVDADAS